MEAVCSEVEKGRGINEREKDTRQGSGGGGRIEAGERRGVSGNAWERGLGWPKGEGRMVVK